LITITFVALSVVGILTLSYVGLRPQNVRQRKANQKYRDNQIAELAKTNRNPNLKEQDRETYTEDFSVNSQARVDVDNMFNDGRVTYPQVALTDARLIVIGTILSVMGVFLQSLVPSC